MNFDNETRRIGQLICWANKTKMWGSINAFRHDLPKAFSTSFLSSTNSDVSFLSNKKACGRRIGICNSLLITHRDSLRQSVNSSAIGSRDGSDGDRPDARMGSLGTSLIGFTPPCHIVIQRGRPEATPSGHGRAVVCERRGCHSIQISISCS